MEAKTAIWGNSIAIRVPRKVADAIALRPGESVEVTAVPDGLNIRRSKPSRYPHATLAEMVAEMDRLGPQAEPEVVDWGPDRGAEIIRDD